MKNIEGNKKHISCNYGLILVDLLCCNQSMHSEVEPNFHVILVHLRLRLKKIEKEIYSSFTITLDPTPEDTEAEVNIKIMLVILFSPLMHSSKLARLYSEVRTDAFLDNGKITLVIACWTLADNSNLCAFWLVAGMKEKINQLSCL
jgi:hypothetical protein